MIVSVPQCPWYGDTELELEFPDLWEVVNCKMAGHDTPKLNAEQIQNRFDNTIGSPRISQVARGKKEVVIIFDDLSRPTRVAELVPYVLRELEEAGIKDDNIRFMAALGAHGALRLMDFEKKLGPGIVRRFRAYNHNPYDNCIYLGETSQGTPISINSEVMSCDLKISIGSILPHVTAGFGGGAKSVIPGVASIDSIIANHKKVGGRSAPTPENPLGNLHHSLGWGRTEGNVLRKDMEEAARMAGLDIIVNTVVNIHREIIGLFVGDLSAAHAEGVKLAKKVYATDVPGPRDIVVSNAYMRANEAMHAVSRGNQLLKEEGGDMIITANIPEGQICHYLARSFGTNIGGCLWGPRTHLPTRTKRMMVLSTYIDRVGLDWLGPPEKIKLVETWDGILDILKASYGSKARVAVIPDGTVQFFPAIEGTP